LWWRFSATGGVVVTHLLRRLLPRANRGFDALCGFALLLAVFAVSNAGRMPEGADDFLQARISVKNVILLVVFLIAWNTAFAAAGLHNAPSKQSLWRQALLVIRACTVGALTLPLFALTSASGLFRMWTVGAFWVTAIVVEIAGRSLLTLAARYLTRRASSRLNIIIVGSGPRSRHLFEEITTTRSLQYRVLGFVDSPHEHEVAPEVRERMLGSIEELEALLAQNPVDLVLVSLPVRSCYAEIQHTISVCESVGVEAQIDLSDFFSLSLAKARFDRFEPTDELPAMRLSPVTEDYRLVVKRLFDVFAAAGGLLVLLPVFAVCGVLVKLSGPGPVFFTQQRYGYNRRLFRMYKFRTMVADAERLQASLEDKNEAQGPIFKIRKDPRITPVGRILRKTSMDELPQLINVLIGDMSIVGPRPMSMRDVQRFTEARLMRRFSVRPGITCLWQVSGRSNTTFDTWLQLDLAYIDNWSLSLDAQILLKTVPAVISGSGAA
jgi:exopolysaccharide biosynthesis polyprenyl glycosylphosphotransferase